MPKETLINSFATPLASVKSKNCTKMKKFFHFLIFVTLWLFLFPAIYFVLNIVNGGRVLNELLGVFFLFVPSTLLFSLAMWGLNKLYPLKKSPIGKIPLTLILISSAGLMTLCGMYLAWSMQIGFFGE